MFNPFAQHAAAQQKCIELVLICFDLIQTDAAEAIVAEPVADFYSQAPDICVSQEGLDLTFGPADSGKVELVGFESQLRHSAQLIFSCLGDVDAELQPLQELPQGECLLAVSLPLRVFLIHLCPI